MTDLTTVIAEMDKRFTENQKYAAERLEKNKKHVENTFLFLQEATANGLRLDTHYDMTSPVWDMDLGRSEDWRTLHNIVGEMENYSVEPATTDLRKRVVWVYLAPKDAQFKHLRFRYQRKLGRGEKCKLVREKSSYVSMQCE